MVVADFMFSPKFEKFTWRVPNILEYYTAGPKSLTMLVSGRYLYIRAMQMRVTLSFQFLSFPIYPLTICHINLPAHYITPFINKNI